MQNFTIIYIKTGFPRLSVSEKLELVPSLFTSLKVSLLVSVVLIEYLYCVQIVIFYLLTSLTQWYGGRACSPEFS